MEQQDDTQPADAPSAAAPPVGDWLVVPGPLSEHLWKWGRIVEVLPGHGPAGYLVRWYGDTHETAVVPPPDARIESVVRWPTPGSGAVGLWPDIGHSGS